MNDERPDVDTGDLAATIAGTFGYLEAAASGGVTDAATAGRLGERIRRHLATDPGDPLLEVLAAALARRPGQALNGLVGILADGSVPAPYRSAVLRAARLVGAPGSLLVDVALRLLEEAPGLAAVQAEVIATLASTEDWTGVIGVTIDEGLTADTTTVLHRSRALGGCGDQTGASGLLTGHIRRPESGLADDPDRLADVLIAARGILTGRADLVGVLVAALEIAPRPLAHPSTFAEVAETAGDTAVAAAVFDSTFDIEAWQRPAALPDVASDLIEAGFTGFLLLVADATDLDVATVESAVAAAELAAFSGIVPTAVRFATRAVQRATTADSPALLSPQQHDLLQIIAPLCTISLSPSARAAAGGSLGVDPSAIGTRPLPPGTEVGEVMTQITEQFRAGDPAGALRAATRASILQRRSSLPLGLIIEALIEAGQHREAMILTGRLAALYPDDAGVDLRTAKLATWYGRDDIAVSVLRRSLRRRPPDVLVTADLLDWFANADPTAARQMCAELLADPAADAVHPAVLATATRLDQAYG